MKKKVGIFFGILIIFLICIYLLETTKSSTISDYNMNIDVNVDGSVAVKELRKYNFINNDNNIILNFSVIGRNNIIDKFNIYAFKNTVIYYNIKIEQDGKTRELVYQKNSKNKEDNIRMLDKIVAVSNNTFGVKVDEYMHKGVARVSFDYFLEKAITKYNDKTQIHLNISDLSNKYDIGHMEVNFNINNSLENSSIQTFNYNINGVTENQTLSNNVGLDYNNISAGSGVQSRILYDAISNSKVLYENDTILDKLKADNDKHKELTQIDSILQMSTIGFAICLFIYWICLLIKYDFNKLDSTSFPSYEEIVDSLSPIVAACIIDERKLENKDLIASLVGLSAKNIINIKPLAREFYEEKLNNSSDKNDLAKEEYIEFLKDQNTVFLFKKNDKFWANKKNIDNLDEIERQVIELFFEEKQEFVLDLRLYEIKNDMLAQMKIKGIDDTIDVELDKLGANMQMNPIVKIVNKSLFILAIVFLIAEIIFNIYYTATTKDMFNNYSYGFVGYVTNALVYFQVIIKSLIVVTIVSIFLEVIIYFSYFVILFLDKTTSLTLKFIKEENPNFNSKIYMNSISKVTKMASKIFAVCILISVAIFLIIPTHRVFIYVLLFAVALIILITDDYMRKHSEKISKLYLGINVLQNKIGYGSLLKQKDLKDTIIWNKYLAFSLAFGISNIEDYTNILKNKSNTADELNEYITNTQLYVDLLESFLSRGSETAFYARASNKSIDLDLPDLFNQK
jgi:hypothetical protein